MVYYATRDADGTRIRQDADIQRFETKRAMRDWLLGPYSATEWKLETAVLSEGDYGDGWQKWHGGEPAPRDIRIRPFQRRDLIVQHPGQHPGGKAWWITPCARVYVISRIEERE